jgi:transcriptional regulator NrdR family protein
MICEICGGKLKVDMTIRLTKTIKRELHCLDCGNQYTSIESIKTVAVRNPQTLRVEQVAIEKIDSYRPYLEGRALHPQHQNTLWD